MELKLLMTLGLVHAGRLTVTRGMQGLLSAPCQTISATRAKFRRQGVRNRRKRQNGTRTCNQQRAANGAASLRLTRASVPLDFVFLPLSRV